MFALLGTALTWLPVAGRALVHWVHCSPWLPIRCAGDWTDGRLQVTDTPLLRVVDELARHHRGYPVATRAWRR
ncbi:hypothetical protein QT383_19960 [Stenotrophomonas rhizophila]